MARARPSSSRRARPSQPEVERLRELLDEPTASPRRVAALPVYRTYVEPGRPGGSRTHDRAARSRRPACPSACARPWSLAARRPTRRRSLRFQQTTGAGHGQGGRGHRLLPLHPAARAQRGGRRPGPLRALRRRSSTPPTSSARRALPARAARHPDPRHQALGRRARAHRRAAADGRGVGEGCALAGAERAAARRRRPTTPARSTWSSRRSSAPGRSSAERLRPTSRRRCARPRSHTGWAEPDEALRGGGAPASRGPLRVRGASPDDFERLRRARRAARRARGARPDAAQADLPRACPTSTRATSSGPRPRRPRQPPAGRLGGAPRGAGASCARAARRARDGAS